MHRQNYLTLKEKTFKNRTTNIVDLIKETKTREKREKRQNIYIAAAAVSVLAISGYIITQ